MKNVILLTIDTLRKDVLGCYGNPEGLSPFLDSIQDHCIRFNNTQAVGPYTQASFPGILASSFYLDHPDHGKGKTLSPERKLVSQPLKEKNITTAAFHSNAYMCEVFGWNRAWDTFYDGMEAPVTDEVPYVKGNDINKKVDTWLGSRSAPEKPFFLWTHYMDIHEPYVPPREYVDRIDPSITLNSSQMFDMFINTLLPRDLSDRYKVETLKKLYKAHVMECDDYVRNFFSILENHNVLDNAVVIITSDHGDEFGEHGGLSHDGKMYSELVAVPLMIFEKDRTGNVVCDTLVSNADIPPTIVSLLGLDPVAQYQGQSLLPLDAYPEKGCFGEAIGKSGKPKETDRPVYYYREKDLKIIYAEEGDAWEMYDLAADPGEQQNIVGSSPSAGEMQEKLKQWIQK